MPIGGPDWTPIDIRKLLAKEAKPLTYGNAVLQEKAAELIDHGRDRKSVV